MDQTPEIVEEDIVGSIKAKSGKEISILKFDTEEEIIGTSSSSEMAGKSTHQSSDLASEDGSWRNYITSDERKMEDSSDCVPISTSKSESEVKIIGTSA